MSHSQNNWPFVINVGNSIIGVTVLAMPFCFKMCGIVLGFLLLMFSTWLTMTSCHLLMKAGVTSRRRSYSMLASYTLGASGKLIVELCMIGLQLGTLVAQIVIIGDLGPAIVSKALGVANTPGLRTALIVCLCLFVGLPLGLLKDVRTLSKTSTLCILFYACFTVYIFLMSIPNLIAGDWVKKVNFWRFDGFFQCLPIFSFAFGCQTQLFIVYDALTEPSLKRMHSIVSMAVNMCTVCYLLVGFFGYVAFCHLDEISGDIITHLRENSVSDAIKLCFVFSIAVTIPLIVFPCRTSLYTLLFPQKPKEDMPGSWMIPELHFKVITTIIIVGSMIIGILVPNIEFVLGINGATMGTLICYVFPALFFLTILSSSTDGGKWTGRMVLAFGLTILIASTYSVLNAQDKAEHHTIVKPTDQAVGGGVGILPPLKDGDKIDEPVKDVKRDVPLDDKPLGKPPDKVKSEKDNDTERHEPPIPQAPPDNAKVEVKEETKKEDPSRVTDANFKQLVKDKIGKIDENQDELKDMIRKDLETDKKIKSLKEKEEDLKKEEEKKKEEERKKEEEELKRKEAEKKQEAILNKIEHQQEEQQKLLAEQKQILEELKEHQEKHKEEEKKVDAAVDPGKVKDAGANVAGGGVNAGKAAAGGNVLQQQILANQRVVGQQPLGGNKPVDGGNKLAGGDQQALGNQPLGGNQLAGGIQLLGGNQPVLGNQPIGGNQPVLANQPVGGNQPLIGNPVPVGNQPVLQQDGLKVNDGGKQERSAGGNEKVAEKRLNVRNADENFVNADILKKMQQDEVVDNNDIGKKENMDNIQKEQIFDEIKHRGKREAMVETGKKVTATPEIKKKDPLNDEPLKEKPKENIGVEEGDKDEENNEDNIEHLKNPDDEGKDDEANGVVANDKEGEKNKDKNVNKPLSFKDKAEQKQTEEENNAQKKVTLDKNYVDEKIDALKNKLTKDVGKGAIVNEMKIDKAEMRKI